MKKPSISQARVAVNPEEACYPQVLQQGPRWTSPVKTEMGPQAQSLLSTHVGVQDWVCRGSVFPTTL